MAPGPPQPQGSGGERWPTTSQPLPGAAEMENAAVFVLRSVWFPHRVALSGVPSGLSITVKTVFEP